MKSFAAFTGKEFQEQMRTGKLLILGLIFILFGIMNPAIAKLTPYLFDMLQDSLKESGMVVTEVKVTAFDSWTQFYKNIPMALIAFILLESSIFTKEYEKGTLILVLTKGLKRSEVLLGKWITLVFIWTAGYGLCFGITYAYTAYFWDQSLVENLFISAFFWWCFGMFVISLLVLMSVIGRNSGGVLALVGGVVFILLMVGMIPEIDRYLPGYMLNGTALIRNQMTVGDCRESLLITALAGVVCMVFSFPILNNKEL